MNLHGPVRVAEIAGSGTATVVLTFDGWPGVEVGPTLHQLQVQPAKAGPKVEPVAANLIGSLVHPDRSASLWTVKFSPDGQRLFVGGYPSGVVQVWDVAAKREVRRIESPRGYRGFGDYASITPDWKTLYIPLEVRKVKPFEKDGKRVNRIDYSGEIKVWDMTTGEPRPALKPPAETAPSFVRMSPDGRFIVSIERYSYDTDDLNPKNETAVWDLATGTRRVLVNGYFFPALSPDGRTVAGQILDPTTRKTTLKLFDLTTGKELAGRDSPENGLSFEIDGYSPDGSVVAVSLGGKKGAAREVLFLDAKTLAEKGRFVGAEDPDGYGWGGSAFTPDGKRFVVIDAKAAHLWDIAGGKVVKSFDTGSNTWRLAVSPDGKTLAVGWMPERDKSQEGVREPDPRDLPQPRVTLFDLAGDAPPRVLVCPHGYVGGVAFSPDGRTLAFGGAGAVHLFDLGK